MSYLKANCEFHESLKRSVVPYTWREYSSWRLISELSRRWPGEFTITECPASEGLGPTSIWYMSRKPSIDVRPEPTVLINNLGSIHVTTHDEYHDCEINHGLSEDQDQAISSLAVLYATDLENILLDLETCFDGNGSPVQSPPTLPSTIGQRMIAAALGLALHTTKPLRVSGFLFDGVEEKKSLIEPFAKLMECHRGGEDLSQVFVVCESESVGYDWSPVGSPLFAVDLATGYLYGARGEVNLMAEYAKVGRNIDVLAFQTIQAARSEMAKR
jgi:hypothetical protein